ncbi:hypothetical protein ES288_D01G156600v1 [Gossypium darwinii]|uniref:GRF-type domain-containing protein n=1 Tax=Gossypium darwinii TaxID=34276 RepID=A0A5D2DQX7_GOSDA|nr:hypothetical protein ES288_D01G156600v1 [Gossypium darwinii]
MPELIPVCYCGNPAKLNTPWPNDNPGRRFLGCKKFASGFQKPCRFFTWSDPPLTPLRTLEDVRRRERKTRFLVLVFVTVLLLFKP